MLIDWTTYPQQKMRKRWRSLVWWAASQKMQKRSCASISIGPQPKKQKKLGKRYQFAKKKLRQLFNWLPSKKCKKKLANGSFHWLPAKKCKKEASFSMGCQPKNAKNFSYSFVKTKSFSVVGIGMDNLSCDEKTGNKQRLTLTLLDVVGIGVLKATWCIVVVTLSLVQPLSLF